LWVLFTTVKPTEPAPLPLVPDVIWINSGLDDIAVHAPHAALGVTVNVTGTSGATPQFGWPELLGHASTVEVPVLGTLAEAGVRPNEHVV
jgi:hypothetical protein